MGCRAHGSKIRSSVRIRQREAGHESREVTVVRLGLGDGGGVGSVVDDDSSDVDGRGEAKVDQRPAVAWTLLHYSSPTP